MSRPYPVEKFEKDQLARSGKKKGRPLKWWQSALAEYMGTAIKRPKPAEYLAKANELANKDTPDGSPRVELSLGEVRQLFKNPVFRRQVALFEIGQARAARKIIERDAPDYMRGHRQALEYALKEKDPRAIAAVTVPVMDRVWPKKQEQSATVAAVKIVLTDAQKSLMDVQTVEGGYEVVKKP